MAGLGSQFRGFKVFRFVFWRLGVMAVNKFPHFPKNRSAVLRSLVSVPLCLGYFVVQPVPAFSFCNLFTDGFLWPFSGE